MVAETGSPFDCETCTDKQRDYRNCQNEKGLSDNARFVEEYTDEISEELKDKGAKKAFTWGRYKFFECPLTYFDRDTADLIGLVILVDNTGALLHAGGWGDQPTWLIEAYRIFKEESSKEMQRTKKKGTKSV